MKPLISLQTCPSPVFLTIVYGTQLLEPKTLEIVLDFFCADPHSIFQVQGSPLQSLFQFSVIFSSVPLIEPPSSPSWTDAGGLQPFFWFLLQLLPTLSSPLWTDHFKTEITPGFAYFKATNNFSSSFK